MYRSRAMLRYLPAGVAFGGRNVDADMASEADNGYAYAPLGRERTLGFAQIRRKSTRSNA